MSASGPRLTQRPRVAIVAAVLAVWVAGIEARLVHLQVIRRADLSARAERQQKRTQEALSKRGDILDRRGRVLATSVDADTIYAVPSDISNPQDAARRLCDAFRDCTTKERQLLTERFAQQKAFAYVRRQVGPEVARRVAALNLDGIGFLKESKRFYPNKELAAHLLGWVGIDNNGLGGLEYTYDRQIRGRNGTILIQTDARRHAFSRVERPPTAGSSVELTIDEYLQHVAERELHAGVIENRALGGSAIIMNPRTGEILAMANEPTFNPNAYREFEDVDRRNRAVQDLYEPGSTFKIVTVSAALDERVMSTGTLIDTNPGMIRLGSRVVTEAKHHNYGVLSLGDVIVRSSNVGAIRIGFRVGTDRLSRYVQRFGFGRPASPDFSGENPGIVWDPEKWTDSALMSVSMGYQVGVTPIQMATAFGAVANGGEVVEPRVIRALYRDNRRFVVRPKVVRRAIAPDTAASLIGIMEGVVDDEHGTARAARIPGFTIAGKTGTANKLVNGRYTSDTYASFAGFLPSRNPAVTILVVLDSARGNNGHYGGAVAAPIFQRIADAAIRYLGVPPNINPAPPVLVARHEASASTESPLTAESNRSAGSTGPGVHLANGDREAPVVTLVADGPSGTVPDVRGMSAREAVRTLVKLGLTARLSGSGVVVSQSPLPGQPVEPGTICRLTLARSVPRDTADVVHP